MTPPDIDTIETDEEQKKPKLSLEVDVQKPSACERHVVVTVSRADIDRYHKEAVDKLQPKAEVPGFRPGRAPRKLVETRFRDEVAEQVKGSVLVDAMTQVSDECEFSAISEPDFDYDAVEIPDEGPLTFEFDVEVRPEFEMPEWRGLELERPVRVFTDEDVQRRLEELLRRYGRLVHRDGPAAPGDVLLVNITSRRNGQELVRIERETVELLPTLSFRDAKIEGFDQWLAGAEAGQRRTRTVTLDADQAEEGGGEVELEIEILDVRRPELPELDDEFLDRLGGFESEGDLRDAIRHDLDRQLRYHQQQSARRQITSFLTGSADWELPKELLSRQARRELERAVLELRSSGFSDEVIQAHANELRRNSLAATETALKEHFILERIAEEEKLEVEPRDIDDEIILIANQSDQSPRRVRARLEKRGQMDALRNQIIERKAIQLIASHATFKDVPFEPPAHDTVALDQRIGGRRKESEIPEAKPGGEAQPLPSSTDRS